MSNLLRRLIRTGPAAKGVIAIISIGLTIYFAVQLYYSWLNVGEAEKTANEANQNYIETLEELYGPDRSTWPKCHLETLKYIETHPLIRTLQYGTTEMPKFC
ncbi:MAG: hypothetical protein WAL24_09600 [Nitrososphaeraceae archaeon]